MSKEWVLLSVLYICFQLANGNKNGVFDIFGRPWKLFQVSSERVSLYDRETVDKPHNMIAPNVQKLRERLENREETVFPQSLTREQSNDTTPSRNTIHHGMANTYEELKTTANLGDAAAADVPWEFVPPVILNVTPEVTHEYRETAEVKHSGNRSGVELYVKPTKEDAPDYQIRRRTNPFKANVSLVRNLDKYRSPTSNRVGKEEWRLSQPQAREISVANGPVKWIELTDDSDYRNFALVGWRRFLSKFNKENKDTNRKKGNDVVFIELEGDDQNNNVFSKKNHGNDLAKDTDRLSTEKLWPRTRFNLLRTEKNTTDPTKETQSRSTSTLSIEFGKLCKELNSPYFNERCVNVTQMKDNHPIMEVIEISLDNFNTEKNNHPSIFEDLVKQGEQYHNKEVHHTRSKIQFTSLHPKPRSWSFINRVTEEGLKNRVYDFELTIKPLWHALWKNYGVYRSSSSVFSVPDKNMPRRTTVSRRAKPRVVEITFEPLSQFADGDIRPTPKAAKINIFNSATNEDKEFNAKIITKMSEEYSPSYISYDNRRPKLASRRSNQHQPQIKRGGVCERKWSGMTFDPNDCSSFFVCIGGKILTHETCPANLFYNSESGRCDYPGKIPTRDKCSGKIKANVLCRSMLPNISAPHVYRCDVYFSCHYGYLVAIKSCPARMMFDVVSRSCLPESQVECNKRMRGVKNIYSYKH